MQNSLWGRNIKRAWAFWYLANLSFGCNLTAGFGYDKNGMRSKVIRNKRDPFTEELAQRIQNTQLETVEYAALQSLQEAYTVPNRV